MTDPFNDLVARWVALRNLSPTELPAPLKLDPRYQHADSPTRPAAQPSQVESWEHRHGFRLPEGLRTWLVLSDGFYLDGPLIHPLSAIGPMVPFARVPGMHIQPESWFELGNPSVETICIDLAYRWPGGDFPVFRSGDDQVKSSPRLIAPSFDRWFLEVLKQGGAEYWFQPNFQDLGDPWLEHCRHTKPPAVPARLTSLIPRARTLLKPGVDDRAIASLLQISRGDVELLFRHLQHQKMNLSPH